MTDEVNGTQIDEDRKLDEAQRIAQRIAARAEIRDVKLLSTTANLDHEPEGSQLTYQLKMEPSVQIDDENDGFFVVLVKYSLAISDIDTVDDGEAEQSEQSEHRSSDDTEESANHVATLEFTHAGLFQLTMRPGDEPASTAELEAYAKSTGYFALYPYSREYIYNTTGRLGLPPLTVGVLRLHAPFDD